MNIRGKKQKHNVLCLPKMTDWSIFFTCCSDKGSGHGILEFSTDKAGQDVTPLNLEFDEPKQRSSTLNSITGEQSLFLSFRLLASKKRFFSCF